MSDVESDYYDLLSKARLALSSSVFWGKPTESIDKVAVAVEPQKLGEFDYFRYAPPLYSVELEGVKLDVHFELAKEIIPTSLTADLEWLDELERDTETTIAAMRSRIPRLNAISGNEASSYGCVVWSVDEIAKRTSELHNLAAQAYNARNGEKYYMPSHLNKKCIYLLSLKVGNHSITKHIKLGYTYGLWRRLGFALDGLVTFDNSELLNQNGKVYKALKPFIDMSPLSEGPRYTYSELKAISDLTYEDLLAEDLKPFTQRELSWLRDARVSGKVQDLLKVEAPKKGFFRTLFGL